MLPPIFPSAPRILCQRLPFNRGAAGAARLGRRGEALDALIAGAGQSGAAGGFVQFREFGGVITARHGSRLFPRFAAASGSRRAGLGHRRHAQKLTLKNISKILAAGGRDAARGGGQRGALPPLQDRREFARPLGRADFLRWLAASLICRSSYREKA